MTPERDMHSAFRETTRARGQDVSRQLARLRSAPPDHGRSLWIGSGLALAAAAALVLFQSPVDVPLATRDLPVERGLWQSIVPGVFVQVDGGTQLSGSTRAPRLTLQTGHLLVDVEPGSVDSLWVYTVDGRVEVVGTRFEVTRDALGSAVRVERGKVRLHCERAGQVSSLETGVSGLCVPATPGGLLGRARALQRAGAGTEAVLEATRQGLEVPAAEGPVTQELRYVQLEVLRELGESAAALDVALDYLAGPAGPRGKRVARTAITLAGALDLCPRVSHLEGADQCGDRR